MLLGNTHNLPHGTRKRTQVHNCSEQIKRFDQEGRLDAHLGALTAGKPRVGFQKLNFVLHPDYSELSQLLETKGES